MAELETVSDIKIERLAAKGDGVSKAGVFVVGALPGEVVEGDVSGGRIEKPRIVMPSVDRVRPPCRHAKSCGGCVLQHASDEFVANWKTELVMTALSYAGLETDLRPIQTSPIQSRRRAALSGRKTKSGALVGFHARGSDTIVGIPDCTLLAKPLLDAIPAIEELTRLGATRKNEMTFHLILSPEGVDVWAVGGRPLDRELLQTLGLLANKHELARLTWDDELVAAPHPVSIRMGPALVPVPPGAFLQATLAGQDVLTDAVQEIVAGHDHIVDLFAGAGTFSLPAAQAAEVHAVEGSKGLLDALNKGWRFARGVKNVTTEVRDLFRNPILVEDLTKFDAAIIDPPRAGAIEQVKELAGSGINKIAFVSCNPTTFARDAVELTNAGFTLDWVQPVDQFRWSTHIELVSSFSR